MTTVREVIPEVDADILLAGAQFIDAYRIETAANALGARQAAEQMFSHAPRWIDALLRLRNILVAPFRLKTSGEGDRSSRGMVGLFPVISETPERLVVGFNDRHLDFRVVIDVASAAQGRQVTSTTLVKTHNLLGRTYLTLILPFHRLVVRSMMRQIAEQA
jgi:hypothetical protein